MSQDKYARKVEKAIHNWYYGGTNAEPVPVFNAIHAGMDSEMQMLVPTETPETLLKQMGDPEGLKPGDVFSAEDVRIKFRQLAANEDGQYFIPLFTCEAEMQKGEATSVINHSFKELLSVIENWPNCLGLIINPWDKRLWLSKDMLKILLNHKAKSHISFVKGSVLDMHVDAIVNAANTGLLGGGGVDGAIHEAAGPELLSECQKLHGCKTGEAKITSAYNITHADQIIHAVGPVYRGKDNDAVLLSASYRNSMDLALQNDCSSVAFPGISTGVYGFPHDLAAEISLITVVRWFEAHPDIVMDVYFTCFKDDELEAYLKLINA